MQELKDAIRDAAKKLFDADINPILTRPDEKFGDYATNAALQLATHASKAPHEIAQKLITELQGIKGIEEVSFAGPGFINFKLTDEALGTAAFAATNLPRPNAGQEILVEFGDPNPFKEMHIGHLYSYIVGDSIAKLLETSGATVRRLSYHGDVGLHVAKAIWAMRQKEAMGVDDLGAYYAKGAQAYEVDANAKSEIEEINRHIYDQDEPGVNKLRSEGSKISFEYFDKILNLLSIKTDRRYLESQTTGPGKKLVEENVGRVFKQSQGAIIFEGENVGLHTRVFLTSKNLPTYETKDLGLVMLKNDDYPNASRSIVITATEQSEYFKVMLAALAEINSELASKTTHIAHGFVNLSTGKMSSRTGDVYGANELLDTVRAEVNTQYPDAEEANNTYVAATKYGFLKHRLGADISYDVDESVSLEGNSGPYLQYAHARASSILEKAGDSNSNLNPESFTLDPNERSLARKITEYPEVVEKAVNELMPHHIANYLYELAQAFNRFYETSRIIGDERQNIRIKLTNAYKEVLGSGLGILNITAPHKM